MPEVAACVQRAGSKRDSEDAWREEAGSMGKDVQERTTLQKSSHLLEVIVFYSFVVVRDLTPIKN